MALNHLPEFRGVTVLKLNLKFVFNKWRNCKVDVASER